MQFTLRKRLVGGIFQIAGSTAEKREGVGAGIASGTNPLDFVRCYCLPT